MRIALFTVLALAHISIVDAAVVERVTKCGCQANKPAAVDENVQAMNNLSESIMRFIHMMHDPASIESSAKMAGETMAESMIQNMKEAGVAENVRRQVMNLMAKHLTTKLKQKRSR